MNFQQKLEKAIKKNNSLLCVGLDTNLEKIPRHLLTMSDAVFTFNKAIIDKTADLVCCYKLSSAFFEAEGGKGWETLKKTIQYIHQEYPEIPVILDAKRGDVENTNEAYTKAVFDDLKTDAVTVSPYLGGAALQPFLNRKDKGIFVLVKTSNPGAGEFQDLDVGSSGMPLYQVIAQKVASEWNKNGNCGVVVGATYPDELRTVRKIAEDIPILIPGIGAQGGDLQQTLKAGLTEKKSGLIIHSARTIIYAGSGEDFAIKARNEAEKLKEQINIIRYEK